MKTQKTTDDGQDRNWWVVDLTTPGTWRVLMTGTREVCERVVKNQQAVGLAVELWYGK